MNQLVSATLEGNFDLKAAWARLAQAHAVVERAGAPRWPQVDASLSAAHQRMLLGRFGTLSATSLTGSMAAAYELDVWGKLGSGARAAAKQAMAASEDLQALAMTLSSEVVERWFDLAHARARQRLLSQQHDLNQTFLELVTLRFRQGQASALEIYQQREIVAGNQAEQELLKSAETLSHNRLRVLTGQGPEALGLAPKNVLPAPVPLPGVGVPSDLLLRRPDIRAAMHRVEAADHGLAQAVADRYPSVRISGTGNLQANSLNDWKLAPLWNLASNLLMPLIDGGRRAAEARRQRAALAERVSLYGKTVLTAIVEVDNALVQERQQREHIAALEQQLEVSQASLREARNRYMQGLSTYLPVLTGLRALHQTERRTLDARRQLLSFRVQLCRALGGTWTRELGDRAPNVRRGEHTPANAMQRSGRLQWGARS